MGRVPADLQGRRRQEPDRLHRMGGQQIANLNGRSAAPGNPNVPLIADSADLENSCARADRCGDGAAGGLFSADKLVRDQYPALTGRIAQENSALREPRSPAHRCTGRCRGAEGLAD